MRIPNEGGWTFDGEEIGREFDKHVREQLPWYNLATGQIVHLIRHYLPKDGVLYDIGASTGNITCSAMDVITSRRAEAISIEPSKEMVKNFKGAGVVVTETAENFDFKNFDVAVLFLTMMFIPVKNRKKLLDELVNKCNAGGCIIIYDKAPLFSGYMATVMRRLTIAGKVAMSVSPDDIITKELSLSGVQVPYSPNYHNEQRVFQFGEFCGWVIEKGC